MRVAAIYDIHGNLPALAAVFQAIRRVGVDQIVVGGDVLPGPMPHETLAYLLSLDIPVQFIQGNGDREVLALMSGEETSGVPAAFLETVRWVGQQLDQEQKQAIASWGKTLRAAIPGLGDVLFCHATPRNDTEIFTRLTPEDRLVPVFAGVNASVVICGQTHMPFDRMVGGIRVANAGSVGMPFGKPGANWLLLEQDIDFRHTDYDLGAAAERVRGTSYPLAQDFAEHNILKPPSEEETLEAFTRAELRN